MGVVRDRGGDAADAATVPAGGTLLFLAPVLIVVIWWEHGVWFGVAALLGFLSMMRNPLRYLWKRAKGEKPEIPSE